jgi:hypothetical protein
MNQDPHDKGPEEDRRGVVRSRITQQTARPNDCEPQFEELAESKLMSSGDFGVV